MGHAQTGPSRHVGPSWHKLVLGGASPSSWPRQVDPTILGKALVNVFQANGCGPLLKEVAFGAKGTSQTIHVRPAREFSKLEFEPAENGQASSGRTGWDCDENELTDCIARFQPF